MPFLTHLDGPFWDACWPQPCAAWSYGGYSPESLNGTADGILAESWAMGSLVGGARALFAGGIVSPETLLLLGDTPNCDLPGGKPCSTGSLAGDIAAWTLDVQQLGVSDHWGVWALVDGGSEDVNGYGDLTQDGRNLTAKGLLHRARALAAATAAAGQPLL